MTFNQYQSEANKTAHISPDLFMRDSCGLYISVPYVYAGLGLGEAGECQNKIKKIMRDNNGVVTDEIREAIKGEIGGLLWYASQVARALQIPFDDCATYNIAQLKDRQARGALKGHGDNR